MEKKKQAIKSLKWQIVTWSAGLIVFIILSFVGSQDVDHYLSIAAIFISILVFISPFTGIKSFAAIFEGKFKKIIAGSIFVISLELINISFFQIINISEWKSKYERDTNREYVLNEPKRKAAEDKIYSLKTGKDAFDYVNQAILRKKNHRLNDLGFSEYEVLIGFLEKNRNKFGNEKTVQMLLLLNQFGGASDGEWLSELIPEIMLEDPTSVINAQLSIQEYLLPEFKNEKFILGLRNCGCGLPNRYNEEKTHKEIEILKAGMRLRLKKLINDSNKDYVHYLINTCFKADR
ncbi:MAG: hypothetical protein AB2L13_00750 [Spirochaetota bacterium]